MDKLRQLYDAWSKSLIEPMIPMFQTFQGGFTAGAVSMRERALKLAQTKKGNELINAIGSLSDIPTE
jgi:hypothetical protein